MGSKARVIAFYLPQFHPIPENDAWWGPGFTEWHRVAASRPLFRSHEQPKLPGELGFYDLRLPETREAQAELARNHGVEAFCYWHYWFAGKRLLERPLDEVLQSGRPDFPFCMAWANCDWTGIWVGRDDRLLMRQTYPGVSDYVAHFRAVQPALEDSRCVRVDGKPIFLVLRPFSLPRGKEFTDTWRELALRSGIGELFLVGLVEPGLPEGDPTTIGFDARLPHLPRPLVRRREGGTSDGPGQKAWEILQRALPGEWGGRIRVKLSRIKNIDLRMPRRRDYANLFAGAYHEALDPLTFNAVLSNWDNTPRFGRWGVVVTGATPARFEQLLREAVDQVSGRPWEHRLLFLKSWNEWAEGNYVEPDTRHGRGYLEAVRRAVFRISDGPG